MRTLCRAGDTAEKSTSRISHRSHGGLSGAVSVDKLAQRLSPPAPIRLSTEFDLALTPAVAKCWRDISDSWRAAGKEPNQHAGGRLTVQLGLYCAHVNSTMELVENKMMACVGDARAHDDGGALRREQGLQRAARYPFAARVP